MKIFSPSLTLRRQLRCLAPLLGAVWLLAGCGQSKDPAKLATRHDKVFASATGEIKEGWTAVVTALKSKDYAATLAAVGKLDSNPSLTPEQKSGLRETAKAVSDEMYDLANQGDQNALNALKDLKKANSR